MYAWDGQNVWRQTAINATTFTSIGTVNTGGADAGPIDFSQDGSTIVVGDGFGGSDPNSYGLSYTLPVAGGTTGAAVGPVIPAYDFVPVPASLSISGSTTKMLADLGSASGTSSEVDLFDYTTSDAPVPVIQNIPGASTTLAFDSSGRLYVGAGYGGNRGTIYRFTAAQIASAYSSGTPLSPSDGQVINTENNNSGNGMFVDRRGALFVGGPDGVTVFNNVGVGQTYLSSVFSFPMVTYNATNDQFALTPFGGAASIYNASDFRVPVSWNVDASGNWSDGGNWNTTVAPSAADTVVILPPLATGNRTITLGASTTVGALSFDSPYRYTLTGAGPLVLQSTAGAATLGVDQGSHVITAPITLATDTNIVLATDGSQLTVGAISGPGGLTVSGSGALEVQGANTYQGNTTVSGGTLRFNIAGSAQPRVAAGASVSIAEGATLELAGTVSALGSATGARSAIHNDSDATGLLVSSGQQIVGAIEGVGVTEVEAGASLTVDSITQGTLIIDGDPSDPGVLTIAASGNASEINTTAGASFQSFASGSGLARLLERRLQLDKAGKSMAGGDAVGSASIAAIPEPSTTMLVAVACAVVSAFCVGRRRVCRNLVT